MFREQQQDYGASDGCAADKATAYSEIRVASHFAGIGGFDHAFELEGASIVFQCEKDRYCRKVLERHWPEANVCEDIRTLEISSIPDAEIWTAGFPCQDVSLARGNHGRSGLRGNNTSLFFRLAYLAKAKKPKVLLLENVVGLLNSHQGRDFAVILRELTSQGYAVAWRVMNARYFGAPQSRPRVFICAWQGDVRGALGVLFENLPGVKPGPERTAFITEETHSETGAKVAQIAYCVSATSGRHTGLDWSRSYVSYLDRVRRPTPTESERLQGFPADWTIPGPGFKAPARGLDSERYRAVGNAVAIPVVRWIARRLVSRLRKPMSLSPIDDFYATVLKLAPDLRQRTCALDLEHIDEEIGVGKFVHRWKSGGCAFGRWTVEGSASSAPSKIIPSAFVNALDESVPDQKYFLTPNAAAGILRRADAERRSLFPPMRSALEILSKKDTVPGPDDGMRAGDPIAQSSICTAWSKQR